jgi:hypothetical protein
MTGNASSELGYLLRRAEQEAITAIVTDQTPGSPIHRELTRRYSVLAARALVENAIPHPVPRQC